MSPIMLRVMRATERPRVLLVDGPPIFRRWLGRSAMALVLGVGAVGFVGLIRPAPEPYGPASTPVRVATVAPREAPARAPVPETPTAAAARPDVVPQTSGRSFDPAPATEAPARRPDPVIIRAAPTQAPPAAPAVRPGRLFISSRPWGQLYVDDVLVGTTPMADYAIPSGSHQVRIVREGFAPYERTITVAPEQTIRLVDIPLEAIRP